MNVKNIQGSFLHGILPQLLPLEEWTVQRPSVAGSILLLSHLYYFSVKIGPWVQAWIFRTSIVPQYSFMYHLHHSFFQFAYTLYSTFRDFCAHEQRLVLLANGKIKNTGKNHLRYHITMKVHPINVTSRLMAVSVQRINVVMDVFLEANNDCCFLHFGSSASVAAPRNLLNSSSLP